MTVNPTFIKRYMNDIYIKKNEYLMKDETYVDIGFKKYIFQYYKKYGLPLKIIENKNESLSIVLDFHMHIKKDNSYVVYKYIDKTVGFNRYILLEIDIDFETKTKKEKMDSCVIFNDINELNLEYFDNDILFIQKLYYLNFLR